MQYPNENAYFLQQVYSSFTQNVHIQPFHTPVMGNPDYINLHNIGTLVDMEMKMIRENCALKEEQYVEQMLLENPITIERRTNNCQQQPPYTEDEEVLDVVNLSPGLEKNSQVLIKQQRAEACRRSRYNNKIKKAKTKYRHKFMSQKLLQSFEMFNCIHDVVDKVESHLLAKGINQTELDQLRYSYGIENAMADVRTLERTIKIEHNQN